MTHNKEKIIVHIDPDLKELVPGFLQHRRNDIKVDWFVKTIYS